MYLQLLYVVEDLAVEPLIFKAQCRDSPTFSLAYH
jgi:hypothetical protein